MPDVPQPVPISTTARALMAAARKRRTVPVSARHRDRTANSFRVRARLEKRFVLKDEFIEYSCDV